MKRFFTVLFVAILCAVGLAALPACSTNPAATPNATQVTQIQNACAFDAGLRPTVSALLAIPGLARPQEIAAVAAARAVIDPICANPGGSVQANTIAAVTGATAQVLTIATQLQQRSNPAASAPSQ